MDSVNRRGFLKSSTITAAGLSMGSTLIKNSQASPNETINIAVTGLHNRGKGH